MLRRFLLISGMIFLGGMLLGVFLPLDVISEELTLFDDFTEEAASLTGLGLFFFILTQNAMAFATAFFFSPLLLLVPIGSLVLNGAMITVVSRMVLEEQSVGFLAVGLLPHGIIEIPAYILAMSASLAFGVVLMRGVFQPAYRGEVGARVKQLVRYLVVALLLLIPAAFIESFVTTMLLDMFN